MAKQGKVGIVGLGIMGGAFAKQSRCRRLAGRRLRHRSGAPARRCAPGRRDREGCAALAAEVPVIITSLPKPAALDATVQRDHAAGVARVWSIEASTFAIEDKLRPNARCSGPAMSCWTAR